MRASTLWIAATALAVTLSACDESTESDAGTPGVDGGGIDGGAVDGGGDPTDAGTPVDTGVEGTDGGLTLTPGDCTELCVEDDDCAEELGCVDNRCACTSDQRCQTSEFWTDEGCAADEDCAGSDHRCVEWDTTTYCVPDDTDRFGCGVIGSGGPTKVEVTLAEGGGTIMTCVQEDIVCGTTAPAESSSGARTTRTAAATSRTATSRAVAACARTTRRTPAPRTTRRSNAAPTGRAAASKTASALRRRADTATWTRGRAAASRTMTVTARSATRASAGAPRRSAAASSSRRRTRARRSSASPCEVGASRARRRAARGRVALIA